MDRRHVFPKIHKAPAAVMAFRTLDTFVIVVYDNVPVQDLLELASETAYVTNVLYVCVKLLVHVSFAYSSELLPAYIAWNCPCFRVHKQMSLDIGGPFVCVVADRTTRHFVYCCGTLALKADYHTFRLRSVVRGRS